ncbi:MAG TPA: C1 family peptidase, partial [Candidatus Cryptobacteroides sp.]|nr:C1 family peptidase [Candidatus Cryptobacteroides sp.]
MKKFITIALFLGLLSFGLNAQRSKINFPDYEFTTIKSNPITSVKNQNRSGTCWAFCTLSFFESEAIRLGNIKDSTKYPDFSEMFVVHKSYS